MRSKRRFRKGSILCVILDRDVLKEDKALVATATDVLKGGADIIQYRDKRSTPVHKKIKIARQLRAICKKYGRKLIINDHIDIALSVDADGVHLGQGDAGIGIAKRLLGPDKIVGISVNNLLQARVAKTGGASYLGAGAIYRTPIKKGKKGSGMRLLSSLKSINLSVIAIGGINSQRARLLAREGFKSIAVIRAVCCAKNRSRATKKLKEIISR